MYKAIKDDKIRAISATNSEFPCMVKDSVVEDTEHTVEDYSQLITGEWVLKENIPGPSRSEMHEARKKAYEKIDKLSLEKMRKQVLGKWTETMEATYVAKVEEMSAEIERLYPLGEKNTVADQIQQQ